MVFGVSFTIILLYNRMSSNIGYRVSSYVQGRDDIFVYGMRAVYIISGLICMLGALLTAFRLYGKKGKVPSIT
jgi:hypothetical protein